MPVKCNAVVFTEKENIEIQDILLPDIGPEQIGVKTLYSGISAGTELWILTGRYWNTKFPNIPGYQKVGIVEKAGKNVSEYKEGDTVFLRTTEIESGPEIMWAGHTSYSVMNASDSYMFKLPAKMDQTSASLLCMAAIGYHGAGEVMPIQKSEDIAVIGLGLIGQFSAQTANYLGANVIGVDLIPERLEKAEELAGAKVFNPQKSNITEEINKMFPEGLDAVIDASANVGAVNESFHWLRNGGRYCLQGYYPDKTSLDLLWPHIKELTLYNPTDSTPEGAKKCADLISQSKMNIQELITHRVKAENVKNIYNTLLNNPQSVLGAVIEW